RDLRKREARQALKNLLDIANVWNNNKELFDETSPHQVVDEVDEPEIKTSSDEEKISSTTQDDGYQENISQLQRESSNEDEETSQFIKRLNVLRTSSQESVVHADSFGSFRKYMHVERPIQHEFEKVLTDIKQYDEPQLILLCGSVGDGKSHLLAYVKEEKQELMENVIDHNDSTESFNPHENSLDTLEYILEHFDDYQTKS